MDMDMERDMDMDMEQPAGTGPLPVGPCGCPTFPLAGAYKGSSCYASPLSCLEPGNVQTLGFPYRRHSEKAGTIPIPHPNPSEVFLLPVKRMKESLQILQIFISINLIQGPTHMS